jgi:hypothetical protein
MSPVPKDEPPHVRPDPYSNADRPTGGRHEYTGAEEEWAHSDVLSARNNPKGFTSVRALNRSRAIGRAVTSIVFGAVFASFALLLTGILDSSLSVPDGFTTTQTHVSSVRLSADGCSPVAQFDVAGSRYTAALNLSVSPCEWAVGDTVTVSYDLNNIGGTARISDGLPLPFVIARIGFVAIGAFVLVLGVRRLIIALRAG